MLYIFCRVYCGSAVLSLFTFLFFSSLYRFRLFPNSLVSLSVCNMCSSSAILNTAMTMLSIVFLYSIFSLHSWSNVVKQLHLLPGSLCQIDSLLAIIAVKSRDVGVRTSGLWLLCNLVFCIAFLMSCHVLQMYGPCALHRVIFTVLTVLYCVVLR